MHKSAFQYREVLGTVMRTITSRIKTGRIIGAIEVINRQGGTAFDEDDLDILEAFAKAAGKNCVRSSDGG